MSIIQGPAMQGSLRSFYPYQIDQSLRFAKGDNPYLKWSNANKGTPTDASKFTFSAWVKRNEITASVGRLILGSGTGTNNDIIYFWTDDTIRFEGRRGGTSVHSIRTVAIHRDPSAWYHIVVSYDADQASASDRLTIYVNGVAQALTTSNEVDSERASEFSETDMDVYVGRGQYGSSGQTQYFDGYMAELHFVDGTAYTADDFGELKNDDIWIPKETSVTYGTNGWYLDFADSADLGNNALTTNGDNDFDTVSGLVASDVVPDSPTNNFCTLNYVDYKDQGGDLTEGGLYINDASSSANSFSRGTIGVTSGKWYYEVYFVNAVNGGHIGWAPSEFSFTSTNPFSAVGQTPSCVHLSMGTTSMRRTDDVAPYSNSLIPGSYSQTAGGILGVAYDADAGEIKYWLNNTAIDSGNVIVSVGDPSLGWMPFVGVIGGGSTQDYAVNFGQDSTFQGQTSPGGNTDDNGIGDFAYAPPSGYLALCTSNLPDPVFNPAEDATPEDHFNTVLYTGNGTAIGSGGNAITGVGFQPDWVWIKERSGSASHGLYDVVRGVTEQLESDTTAAETTEAEGLTAFGTDGFTVGSLAQVNTNTDTYVAWNWKAGGTASTISVGEYSTSPDVPSIASSVSANTDAGFSIVSYTGAGGTGTVGHGLTQAPEMFMVTTRTGTTGWVTYHSGVASDAETDYLYLNTTAAAADSALPWADTAPTSSVFTVDGFSAVNGSGQDFIAYCFHSVDGFSKAGSYIGNGSTNGAFVYTGFRPKWVMVKRSSGTGAWRIWDAERIGYNTSNYYIDANLSNAEVSATGDIDILSNGFKLRDTDTAHNASGAIYIYLAFAEQPFKYSNAR